MKKLFTNLNMDLKNTILFSLGVGVFCGIFGGLPILADTSFTDMAGGYEWWVIFAVIICVNSKSFLIAGLQCGLFFLITQPLQFYIQALLYSHNFANAFMYFKVWLPVIILTAPGGAIAYFSKKENYFGAIVLGIGNAIEALMAVHYFNAFVETPPRHLIAFLISVSSIFVMTYYLKQDKKYRIIALAVPIVLTGLILAYAISEGLYI